MKRKLIVAAICTLIAAPASASLYCKNDRGQAFVWQTGNARPNVENYAFDIRPNRTVICYIAAYAAAVLLPRIEGLPIVPGIPQGGGAGAIYRGDFARFIIENLPSAEGNFPNKPAYDALDP